MMTQCYVDGEAARLQALHRYEILDTEPEEAFDRITRLVKSVLHMPMAVVSLVDGDRQWFKSRQGVSATETPRAISFCTHTIRDTEPLVVPDAHADPRFANSPIVRGEPHIRFYAGVPLRTKEGYNLGALCSMDIKPRELSGEQLALLQDLAQLVVDELELRLLATTDTLTGTLSRRAFIEQARTDVAWSQRYDAPLSCIILDIDHFKAVNDSYGHGAGDIVLRQFADICKTAMRAGDYVGRIGGEEFAVMLPETPLVFAAEVAERLRQTLDAARIEYAGQDLHVTASLGVAEFSPRLESIENLLHSADCAMYDAKADGRNRIAVFFENDLRVLAAVPEQVAV